MTSRPTVCQVLHSLEVGGAEVLAARLARRLSDQYRFVFACLDDLGPLGRVQVDLSSTEEGVPAIDLVPGELVVGVAVTPRVEE